jgi:hypothetical protein
LNSISDSNKNVFFAGASSAYYFVFFFHVLLEYCFCVWLWYLRVYKEACIWEPC